MLGAAAGISSEPTDEEVLHAIDVLKRAGVNISVATSKPDSTREPVNPSAYINPEYETINMMLGNGNNNNNDAMMNMLPYMMSTNNDGKNLDPQVIQSLMMNSMMNSLGNLNSSDNNK